jgi:hypothetical protein
VQARRLLPDVKAIVTAAEGRAEGEDLTRVRASDVPAARGRAGAAGRFEPGAASLADTGRGCCRGERCAETSGSYSRIPGIALDDLDRGTLNGVAEALIGCPFGGPVGSPFAGPSSRAAADRRPDFSAAGFSL